MNRILSIAAGALAVLLCLPAIAPCQTPSDATQYREVTRTVERPVVSVQMRQEQQTVYRPEMKTELLDTFRVVWVPVTTWQWEQRVHGWLNPFQPNYVTYHLVPRTHWEQRVEKLRVPVSYWQWVPETRVVERPQRTLGMVPEQRVERIAVQPAAPSAAPVARSAPVAIARPQPATGAYGGVARMESDPPRVGTRPLGAGSSSWR